MLEKTAAVKKTTAPLVDSKSVDSIPKAPFNAVPVPSGAPKTKEDAAKLNKIELVAAFGNKSNAIRGLSSLGFTKGQIAKALDIRYQHARNVLSRPLKRDIKEQRDAQLAAKAGQPVTA